jgi:hypothetical protein
VDCHSHSHALQRSLQPALALAPRHFHHLHLLLMLCWLVGGPLQAAAGSMLLMPLEELEASFWGAKQGPGADMQQALAAAHSPQAYTDVPKVCWLGSG